MVAAKSEGTVRLSRAILREIIETAVERASVWPDGLGACWFDTGVDNGRLLESVAAWQRDAQLRREMLEHGSPELVLAVCLEVDPIDAYVAISKAIFKSLMRAGAREAKYARYGILSYTALLNRPQGSKGREWLSRTLRRELPAVIEHLTANSYTGG